MMSTFFYPRVFWKLLANLLILYGVGSLVVFISNVALLTTLPSATSHTIVTYLNLVFTVLLWGGWIYLIGAYGWSKYKGVFHE